MSKTVPAIALFDAGILIRAAEDAVTKLRPTRLVRNPVMFVTDPFSPVVTTTSYFWKRSHIWFIAATRTRFAFT